MSFVRQLLEFFGCIRAEPRATVSVVLKSGYNADKPISRVKDLQLSENFTLWEMTTTSNAALQDMNRVLSDSQVQKLTRLARHAEGVRKICGGPVRIHSAYRCDVLNGATNGASSTSQHPKCEAFDCDVIDQDLEKTFLMLRAEAAAGRFYFGQLILEEAHRDYGVVRWIHVSVPGTLDPSKVGDVLRMKDGAYILVDRVSFEHLTIT